MMSMHKLTAGDGYAYLTRQVAAGDAGLEPGVRREIGSTPRPARPEPYQWPGGLPVCS